MLLETPTNRHLLIHAPFLEINGTPMVNLAQRAAFDEAFGLNNGRDKAIIESDHVFHASFLNFLQHDFGLVCCASKWFLAEDMFAHLRGNDARFGMSIVWPT